MPLGRRGCPRVGAEYQPRIAEVRRISRRQAGLPGWRYVPFANRTKKGHIWSRMGPACTNPHGHITEASSVAEKAVGDKNPRSGAGRTAARLNSPRTTDLAYRSSDPRVHGRRTRSRRSSEEHLEDRRPELGPPMRIVGRNVPREPCGFSGGRG